MAVAVAASVAASAAAETLLNHNRYHHHHHHHHHHRRRSPSSTTHHHHQQQQHYHQHPYMLTNAVLLLVNKPAKTVSLTIKCACPTLGTLGIYLFSKKVQNVVLTSMLFYNSTFQQNYTRLIDISTISDVFNISKRTRGKTMRHFLISQSPHWHTTSFINEDYSRDKARQSSGERA